MQTAPIWNRMSPYAPLAVGIGLFIGIAALYIRTLAPSVMPGDYAEFQMAAAVLGVPHPTGYPLYILLGKLFTFLPLGDIAYRVNLSSAIYMAGAAVLLYATGVRILKQLQWPDWWWTAAVGATFFALSPTVWSMALVARSYALNALLVSSVIFSLLMWRQTERAAWFYAACVLIGMSMAHHGTTYLLLPAYFLYMLGVGDQWPGVRDFFTERRSRIFRGIVALLAGFSPMLFLVYRFLGGSPYYWGNPTTWKDFFSLLTGGPFQNQVMGFGWGAQLDRAVFGLNELSGQYTPVGILLGLVGLVILWRYMRGEAVLFILMLAGNFLFAMNYSLVGYLYFIPTYLIWGLLVGVGIAGIGRIIVEQARPVIANTTKAAFAVGLLALAVYAGTMRYSVIDQSGQTSTRDAALALLRTLPQGANLYLDWEDVSVLRFYRMVYGMRPDIAMHSGDPADWAKWVYCDLTNNVPAYVGEFAGAQPPIIARDFTLESAPIGWRVTKIQNSARYELPPCGTCATCR